MVLNETLMVLTRGRPGGVRENYPEYDSCYHRMQKLGFAVAKMLMTMPQGTLADLGGREFFGVVPYNGQLEVVALMDYDNSREGDDVFWNFIGPVPYSDTDMGGEEELDSLSATLQKWLESPVFFQTAPANKLELLSQKTEAWAVEYAAAQAARQGQQPS